MSQDNLARINDFLKFAGFSGFLVASTIFLGWSYHIFRGFLGVGKIEKLWWIFLVVSLFSLGVFIFIFNFFFGGLGGASLREKGEIILSIFAVKR